MEQLLPEHNFQTILTNFAQLHTTEFQHISNKIVNFQANKKYV